MSFYNRALTIVLAAFVTTLATAPVAAKSSSPLWFEHTDIKMPRNVQAMVLENGLRLVLIQTSQEHQSMSLRLRVGAGVGQEDNLPTSRVIANQIITDSEWTAKTGYRQTVYSLDIQNIDDESLNKALMFITSNVTTSPVANRDESKSANLIDYPQVVQEAQSALATSQNIAIFSDETARLVQIEDLKNYYSKNYLPANMTLVITGNFKIRSIQNEVRNALSDWHSPAPQLKTTLPSLRLADDDITEMRSDSQVSLSALAPLPEDVDSKLMRKNLLLAKIANQILKHRVESALGDAQADASVSTNNTILFNQKLLSQVAITEIPAGEQHIAQDIIEDEIKVALANGFTHSEYEAVVNEIRASKEAELKAFKHSGASAIADRMVASINNGEVYTTPSFELELIDFHIAHLSETDINKEFEKIWAHKLENI